MTRKHLKGSDVVNAAKAIAAQGEIPTIAAVRERLQGRGSETTILNHLRKWKMQLLGFAVFCDEVEIDPSCIFEAQQNYERALQQLDVQNEKITHLENSVAHYKTENLVLMHGIKRLNLQVQQLEMQHAVQRERLDALQKLNAELSVIAALREQKEANDRLQQQLQEIKSAIAELIS